MMIITARIYLCVSKQKKNRKTERKKEGKEGRKEGRNLVFYAHSTIMVISGQGKKKKKKKKKSTRLFALMV